MDDRILLINLTWKQALGIHTCRREISVKIDLKEIGHEGVDWI
jgi:hypothetical protein